MSPEIVAFVGAFAGGAVASMVTAAARYLKLDAHLERIATKTADLALERHEAACPWRAVAASHVASESPQLTPHPVPLHR